MTPDLSFVLPTHNRGRLLTQAVESLLGQRAGSNFEVVVVDNASSDGSLASLKPIAERDSRLRILHEPRLGASNARNTGWRAARARTIVFVDDDVTAPEDYADNVLRAAQRDVAVIGGKVIVRFAKVRPQWLSDSLLEYLSQIDWQPTAGPLGEDQWLASCNLAVRREVLEAVGGFRPDLGPKGRRWTVEEDAELLREVKRRGGTCWYDPTMLVYHNITESRLTRQWFLSRAFWGGVSIASVGDSGRRSNRSILSGVVRSLARAEFLYVLCLAAKVLGLSCERVRRLAAAK